MLPKESYTIEGTFFGCCLCENCGRALTNIAKIKGESGKEYLVGLDCANTLSGAGYSIKGIKEASETMKNRAKFRRQYKSGLYHHTREKNGFVYVYDFEPENERQEERRWSYRFLRDVFENLTA